MGTCAEAQELNGKPVDKTIDSAIGRFTGAVVGAECKPGLDPGYPSGGWGDDDGGKTWTRFSPTPPFSKCNERNKISFFIAFGRILQHVLKNTGVVRGLV